MRLLVAEWRGSGLARSQHHTLTGKKDLKCEVITLLFEANKSIL
jgi:hypothetical protein